MLEASQYADNSFITLTYSDDKLPDDLSLRPADLRNYLKRLRKRSTPARVRYYAAGEYGEQPPLYRPHFHAILFGLPTCLKQFTTVDREGYCCSICSFHASIWGHGNVYLGQCTFQSAAYVAGYLMKKLKGKGEELYAGRYPERSWMSNRPGIGAGFMDEMASTILEHELDTTLEDVPTALRHGKAILPIGRYLTRRLRTRIGRDENTPQSIIEKRAEEMRPLREIAFSVSIPGFKAEGFRQALCGIAEGGDIRLKHLEINRKSKPL